jgi:hypothetical protein
MGKIEGILNPKTERGQRRKQGMFRIHVLGERPSDQGCAQRYAPLAGRKLICRHPADDRLYQSQVF